MALNIATLKTRALTAVVFVAVMLAGLLWNFWSFLILFTIVHFGCWYELVKLMKKIYAEKYLKYCLLGLVYITMPILMMIDLRTSYLGIDCTNGGNILGTANIIYDHFVFPFVIFPLTIIGAIWINDTMAYIVGSLIGKTPLSKISPKKTWEGTIGGVILSVIVTGLLFSNLDPGIAIRGFKYLFSNVHFYVIAALCAIFGTMGDLFESKLKRMADVKDSGTIMPGHGGFLDRFDSLLFAAPVVWVYVKLFM
ncbi:phosphatidate cytidylyltransferase [Ferruginibacter sp.]|nr:phosphatidate cytidylyltransferase [Ferruginibacter sp.]